MAGETRFNVFSNKTTYSTGLIAQSGTTIIGSGVVFNSGMVGGTIQWADDTTDLIIGYTNTSHLTVITNQTKASSAYTIQYHGLGIAQQTVGLSGTIYSSATLSGSLGLNGVTLSGNPTFSGTPIFATGIESYAVAAAYNTTSTIAAADIVAGIITCNGTAQTLTFDTGANIYTAMGSPPVQTSIWMTLVNTGAGNTLAGGSNSTLVGNTVMAATAARHFRVVVTNAVTPVITIYG